MVKTAKEIKTRIMRAVYKDRLILSLCAVCFLFLQFPFSALAEEESGEEFAQNEVLVLYETGLDVGGEVGLYENSDEVEVLSESEEETIALVELPDDITVDDAIEEYGKEAGVIAVTPNYTLELYDNAGAGLNDERIGMQQYLDQVNVKEAWNSVSAFPHQKVRVAVLDTGADINHPDLQNILNLDISRELLQDGSLGPLKGDDYANGGYTGAGIGHGTHVCGILAAESGNMQGIAGVGSCIDNSAIELMVVDIFSNVKTTSLANLISGMEYAASQGAKVINLSLGIDAAKIDDTILRAECSRLYNNQITLVCAAGNEGRYDGGQISDVPSDYSSTIGVISVDENNARAGFSNYGTRKDIAAPGTRMFSTLKNGSYGYKEGTSMSTPVVSATAAMLYSLNPSLTTREVKRIIKNTSSALPGEAPGVGLINCGKAVTTVNQMSQAGQNTDVALPFADIEEGTWHYEPACYVYQRGIMTGMDEYHFNPSGSVSRAQFAVILHRMNGGGAMSYRDAFPDIEEGTWYTDAVLWANSQGVVKGYDNGKFGPSDYITREQMATMLYRYAERQGYDVSEKVRFDYFTDASRVSGFAWDAMQWATGIGMISGKDSGTRIDPQGNTARIECAVMIERFEEKYVMQREN